MVLRTLSCGRTAALTEPATIALIVQFGTLAALVIGFWAQWKREGRRQKWAEESAKLVADKATTAAEAVALKASNEILAQAAEANRTAATLATKVLADANAVAMLKFAAFHRHVVDKRTVEALEVFYDEVFSFSFDLRMTP